jgi:diacylglycerol kinase (ATP)
MMNQFIFLVNSRIGEKKIEELKHALVNQLPATTYQIFITEYGGHAKDLAKKFAAEKYKYIIAVGGDGTVNEVIQAIAETDTILGIIPTGSGNGLARHCSIPLKIAEAVTVIKGGKEMLIDLGKANEVYFISNAGVGFDAVVCNAIKQTKFRGLKMYISKVIQYYFAYKNDTYSIQADDNLFTKKAFFLNVANGKEFGYGFEIAPNASLQDGLLDMILIDKINIWNGLTFVIDGWRKKLIKNKNCLYIRAKNIHIKGSQLHHFQTDGDAHDCKEECHIQVMPKALRIITPLHIDQL